MIHKSGFLCQPCVKVALAMFEPRIALGTVQFGQNYGVANELGQVGIQECGRILDEAFSQGVDTIDTAIGYGDSEVILGSLGLENWKIISKLPQLPESVFSNTFGWVLDQVTASLNRLRVGSLHGLLLHYPDQLLSPVGKDIYQSLLRLKEEGYVKKIGVSIYSPTELDSIFEEMHFDIVQAPFSILDRRLVNSGWLKRLRDANVEVHIRSIFLQGLLLMSNARRPQKFDRWQSIWSEWNRWLEENRLTPLEACLGYVLSIDDVDRVVIGVDSHAQLCEIFSSMNQRNLSLPKWPENMDMELLHPAHWVSL